MGAATLGPAHLAGTRVIADVMVDQQTRIHEETRASIAGGATDRVRGLVFEHADEWTFMAPAILADRADQADAAEVWL